MDPGLHADCLSCIIVLIIRLVDEAMVQYGDMARPMMCFAPKCHNTTKTAKKVYFRSSRNRTKSELARRPDSKKQVNESSFYSGEDHLNGQRKVSYNQ